MQELWSLVRQITPFTLPGPLPERSELRDQLDEIERCLTELCQRAGVPKSAFEIELSSKACALLAEYERLQELSAVLRETPDSLANAEKRLALLEERARIRIRLTGGLGAEEANDLFNIDHPGKQRED